MVEAKENKISPRLKLHLCLDCSFLNTVNLARRSEKKESQCLQEATF